MSFDCLQKVTLAKLNPQLAGLHHQQCSKQLKVCFKVDCFSRKIRRFHLSNRIWKQHCPKPIVQVVEKLNFRMRMNVINKSYNWRNCARLLLTGGNRSFPKGTTMKNYWLKQMVILIIQHQRYVFVSRDSKPISHKMDGIRSGSLRCKVLSEVEGSRVGKESIIV